MSLTNIDPLPILATLGVAVVAFIALKVIKVINEVSARSTRAAAKAMGIGVDDVMREIPTGVGRDRSYHLETLPCVEYHWPRKHTSSFTWQLLMRPDEDQDGLPSGWRFVSDKGIPSPELRRTLDAVMHDDALEGEFFEFEGKPATVSVYWEEWGGEDTVSRLLTYLRSLAEISA
jgi:hypothetical protein